MIEEARDVRFDSVGFGSRLDSVRLDSGEFGSVRFSSARPGSVRAHGCWTSTDSAGRDFEFDDGLVDI